MKKNYLKKMITQILHNNEESRNDMMLTAKIIYDSELASMDKTKEHMYECFFNHKLSSIKTIDRSWRMIQEENENLRGSEWNKRQKKSIEIAQEIIDNKLNNLIFNED